jgi:hypothetical protein
MKVKDYYGIASLCGQGAVELYPGDLFDPVTRRIVELAPAACVPKIQKHAS